MCGLTNFGGLASPQHFFVGRMAGYLVLSTCAACVGRASYEIGRRTRCRAREVSREASGRLTALARRDGKWLQSK